MSINERIDAAIRILDQAERISGVNADPSYRFDQVWRHLHENQAVLAGVGIDVSEIVSGYGRGAERLASVGERMTSLRENLEVVQGNLGEPRPRRPYDSSEILARSLAALRVLDDLYSVCNSTANVEVRWEMLWSFIREEKATLEAAGVDVDELRNVVDSGYQEEIDELQGNVDRARLGLLCFRESHD